MSDSIGAWFDDIELYSPAPGVIAHTHAAHVCAGSACVVHNPSDHHMRDWPLKLVGARALGQAPGRVLVLSERICSHQFAHPDPDSLAYVSAHSTLPQGWWSDHLCDGCCVSQS